MLEGDSCNYMILSGSDKEYSSSMAPNDLSIQMTGLVR